MEKFNFTLHYMDGMYEDVKIVSIAGNAISAFGKDSGLLLIRLADGSVSKAGIDETRFVRKADIESIQKKAAKGISYFPNSEDFANRTIRFLSYVTELDSFGKYTLQPVDVYEVKGVLDTPSKIAEFCKEQLKLHKATEEYVYLIAFDSKSAPLALAEISHGTVNCSLISPREVFIKCLLAGAVGFVLVHNHVSGDTKPSKEDAHMAEVIQSGAQLVGLKFFDSIIVGHGYYSFYEESELLKV